MKPKPVLPIPNDRHEHNDHSELNNDHSELIRLVEQDVDPNGTHEAAEKWKTLGTTLSSLATDISIIIAESHDNWTGPAADSARNALRGVQEFDDVAGEQFIRTGEVIHAQANTADEARVRMPPLVEPTPKELYSDTMAGGDPLKIMMLPYLLPAQQAKADAAHAEAVSVLYARDSALYSATLGMPALAEPPRGTPGRDEVITPGQNSMIPPRTVEPAGWTTTTYFPNGATTTSEGIGEAGTTRTSWTAPPPSHCRRRHQPHPPTNSPLRPSHRPQQCRRTGGSRSLPSGHRREPPACHPVVGCSTETAVIPGTGPVPRRRACPATQVEAVPEGRRTCLGSGRQAVCRSGRQAAKVTRDGAQDRSGRPEWERRRHLGSTTRTRSTRPGT